MAISSSSQVESPEVVTGHEEDWVALPLWDFDRARLAPCRGPRLRWPAAALPWHWPSPSVSHPARTRTATAIPTITDRQDKTETLRPQLLRLARQLRESSARPPPGPRVLSAHSIHLDVLSREHRIYSETVLYIQSLSRCS
ncbi:hypothetical protein QC761_0063760 [Podospora bellae-mahoneyi]|uniref:Uncharacterized protein n=1 Tax=Podospora bellae-mahoneyi TaxID=2093777 RepID=A0ABR0FJS7_9PEZI|nr:hypothetical protein QC761_0063760 [Podospora bellae-mahoneyi]